MISYLHECAITKLFCELNLYELHIVYVREMRKPHNLY